MALALLLPSFRFSLRQKLTLFMSVLVIGACSSLSWYLISQQTRAMEASLLRTGTLIAERLSQSGRFSVISQDQTRLSLLSEGALTIPEVTYVGFLDPMGSVIIEKQKEGAEALTLTLPDFPVLDKNHLPLITFYHRIQSQSQPVKTLVTPGGLLLMAIGAKQREAFIDVLQPISDLRSPTTLTPLLLDDLQITSQDTSTSAPLSRSIYGYIQLCISTHTHEEELLKTIRQVLVITLLIILAALGVTILFSRHLVKPLQALASLTAQVAKGDLTATNLPISNDEIGDLTQSFQSHGPSA